MNTLESSQRPHRLLGIGAAVIEERLRELGLLNLEKRRLRGIFFNAYDYLTAGVKKGEQPLPSGAQ